MIEKSPPGDSISFSIFDEIFKDLYDEYDKTNYLKFHFKEITEV